MIGHPGNKNFSIGQTVGRSRWVAARWTNALPASAKGVDKGFKTSMNPGEISVLVDLQLQKRSPRKSVAQEMNDE